MTHKIHPTAIVDPSAVLGADVEIGAYSIVGANVAIGGPGPGEGNVIAFNENGVQLFSNGARIEGNTIHGNTDLGVLIAAIGTGNRVTRNSIFGTERSASISPRSA